METDWNLVREIFSSLFTLNLKTAGLSDEKIIECIKFSNKLRIDLICRITGRDFDAEKHIIEDCTNRAIQNA